MYYFKKRCTFLFILKKQSQEYFHGYSSIILAMKISLESDVNLDVLNVTYQVSGLTCLFPVVMMFPNNKVSLPRTKLDSNQVSILEL